MTAAATPRAKYVLWTLMAAAALSVLFYSEVPIFQKAQEREQLYHFRWTLYPHIATATLAFLTGPWQFSTRLRRRNPRVHRILGRVYAACVFIAAPTAFISTLLTHYPNAIYFETGIAVQASAWVLTTALAITFAIRRRLSTHRTWAIRSYAVTFTFVLTRVLQPIPAWNRLGRFWFAVATIVITLLAALSPELSRLLTAPFRRSSSIAVTS